MGAHPLSALLDAARAAWPAVDLPDEVFIEHATGRLPPDPQAAAARAGDLFLAVACARGDAAALRGFEDRYMPAAERALARFGGRAFVADALQELRLRLFIGPPARIVEYSGSGALEAWVKVIAVHVALNLLRSDRKHRLPAFEVDEAADPVLEGVNDAELEILKVRYRDDVAAALRESFRALERSDRTLLRLYVVDKLNINEIGRILGRSRATVGRMVIEVRGRILKDTHARLATKLRASGSELDSLLRLVRGQLDLTLSSLLATQAGSE